MNNIFNSGNMKILFLRILSSLLTLFLLVSLLFFLIRLSPGDPSDKYISAKLGSVLSKKVEQEFSLNQPITQQYISFVSNIFRGELGISYNYHQPVFKVIWEYFSFTIIFALLSFSIQISLSIWLAIKVSRKKNRVAEKLTENLALFVYSIPAFVLGVGLILIFSVEIDLLPISGVQSIDYDEMNLLSQLLDLLRHLILPLINLSVPGIAMFYKYIKESMDEVVHKTFITNLKSSGVNDKIIFRKHVLPNALKPLISVAGVELGILLGGTLITEVIFSLPGMGRLAIDSILSRDYPLVIGCVFTAGAVVIIANFLADIVKLKVDKRLIRGILN